MSIVIFRLLDRQSTDSKQVGDETKSLDFAEWYDIKNPFFVREKGGIREEYRYIKGSKFLKMEDQIKAKEIFNPVIDVLGFTSGEDILIDEDFDQTAIEILRLHPWNTKSKFHVKGVNPPVFEEWSAREEAVKEVEGIKVEDEALDIVRSLRNNPQMLKTIGFLFNISTAFSDEEMYLALRKKAVQEPELFITSIANRRNTFLANIRKATEYNVIALDAKGFIFEKEKGLILETSGKPKESESKLLDYLMSESGAEAYKQILVLIEHAEIDLQSSNK